MMSNIATAAVTTAGNFPGLNNYGNYERPKLPKKGVRFIPLDGTIRYVRQLNIPTVDVVDVVDAFVPIIPPYGPPRVGYAISAKHSLRLNNAIRKAAKKRVKTLPAKPHGDLLLCIGEASKRAHLCRDKASAAYNSRSNRHNASYWSCEKENWYDLKERGIMEAHKRGLLRYAGVGHMGMAVYEYGEGGMSCFHSTLHPAGVERTLVEGHPERLFVATKEKRKGISLKRVQLTLEELDFDETGYERSDPPKREREPRKCYECGGEGYIARHCTKRW